MNNFDPVAVLERGRAAGELLRSPAFMDVVNSLSDMHIAAIVSAPPGEAGRAARDYHHLLHYALSEICGDLAGRHAAAVDLESNMKDDDDE